MPDRKVLQLRRQAERSRRLAGYTHDQKLARELLALAREFDEEAIAEKANTSSQNHTKL
jgi:hypothetical protein